MLSVDRVNTAYLVVLTGFATTMALIAAIGAQNAFVLRQGIRGEHVMPVVALCAVSDLVLIFAGIAGFGALIAAHPDVVVLAKYGGAAFLIGYGLLAARRAMKPGALTPSDAAPARPGGHGDPPRGRPPRGGARHRGGVAGRSRPPRGTPVPCARC